MSKKQMGFTLIEIVMVLVLLGILSAVAVPKYFDLRDKAEEKAMAAVAAEYQAQINGEFANQLLNKSAACSSAVSTALSNTQTNFKVTDQAYTVSLGTVSNGTAELTVTGKGTGTDAKSKKFDIAVPICNNSTPATPAPATR